MYPGGSERYPGDHADTGEMGERILPLKDGSGLDVFG